MRPNNVTQAPEVVMYVGKLLGYTCSMGSLVPSILAWSTADWHEHVLELCQVYHVLKALVEECAKRRLQQIEYSVREV